MTANRELVSEAMPAQLQLLEPLLHALGYRWSNHYRNPTNLRAIWSVVSLTGRKIGYMGMTAEEAERQVISLAISRLQSVDKRRRELLRAVTDLAILASAE